MKPTTQPPPRPNPVRLRQVSDGRLPQYVTPDRRFTVTRNPAEPGVRFEDSGYDVVDTQRRNVLGHGHTNRVRVYELADARAVIDKVLRVEWLGELQRYIDTERRAAGMPTVAEEAATRIRLQRTGLGRVAP